MASSTYIPVAICGYSCKLPGSATDAESLWKMCVEGRSAWSEIPRERFNQEAFYNGDKGASGTTNVTGGYFLAEDPFAFDASFFNLTTENAMAMDPAVRLQLESVFEAFEHGGMTLHKVAGSRTSVVAASFHRDYHDSLSRNPDEIPRYLLTGTGTAMLSNRVSHFFDLRGPSMTLDTGCSSSLTSLHTACRSLQAGDCDMSVVTGSNLMLNPDPFISMSGVGLLSPSGRSYAFDARAEGYGRGEGVVTLVLKTLAQAEADGDTIHALIRGSASNQDGKTTTITSPSHQAQEVLIKQCYEAAALNPTETPYVECHGTGTQVGDLCEASAIHNSFQTDRRRGTPLYLGSVKSNIGHLEAASGLASIIKVIKAFQHRRIPPNHDFAEPNPSIRWSDWKLQVPRKSLPWPSDFPRRASVNSFGYGGANAHIILDAPEPTAPRVNGHINGVESEGKSKLFLLSANDERSCSAAVSKLRAIAENASIDGIEGERELLAAHSHSLARERTHFKWRTAVQAISLSTMVDALNCKNAKPVRSALRPSIGFVFTGQGAHWAGMGRELIESFVVFRDVLKQCDECLSSLGASWSVIEELQRDSVASQLDQAEIGMPVCCALQIALVVMLKSWNITPTAVTGHSSGESAAAFAVGALDMRSALAVQYYRGRLTADARNRAGKKGGMLAAGLGPDEAQERIDGIASGRVVIGCFNSPSSVTLSGDEEGILQLEEAMRQDGTFCRKLPVQSAYHSHHMEADAPAYRKLLESALVVGTGRLDAAVASSVTGTWLTEAEEFGTEHWVNYMLKPVQFSKASKRLLTEDSTSQTVGKKPVDIVVEIGPHSSLASVLRQTMQSLKISDIAYTSVLKRSENAFTTAQALVGFVWSRGYPVDLDAIIRKPRKQGTCPNIFDLPSYPWNHATRFEIVHPSEAAFRQRAQPRNPLIGVVQPCSNPASPAWQRQGAVNGEHWPWELTVDDVVVSPQSWLLGLAVEAARELTKQLESAGPGVKRSHLSLSHVEFDSDVRFSRGSMAALFRTSLHEVKRKTPTTGRDSALVRDFQVHCIRAPNEWSLLCQGRVIATVDGQRRAGLQLLEHNSGVNTVALRPGLLQGGSQPDSVNLEFDTPSASLVVHGQWRDPTKDGLDEPSLMLRKLASAFEEAGNFNALHPTGISRRVPVSIESLDIRLNTSGTISPNHVSKTSLDDGGGLTVNWSQVEKGDNSLSHDIEIRGMKFQTIDRRSVGTTVSSANEASQAHALSLRRSVINITHEKTDHIPRYTLTYAERRTLLDLNTMCRGFFHQTLTALRQNPPRRLLGHSSAYVQFMKSIESECSAEWLQLSDAEVAALRSRVVSSSVNGELVCLVGDSLVPFVRGAVDPLEVMMKDRLLHRYYEEGLRWTRSYEQLKALVEMISFEYPRMEILEIGAGTGGATTSVLQALEQGEDSVQDIRCESYTYTDISAGFFPKAKEKFDRYGHVMQFKKLDIGKDLKSQGYEGQTYDFIVASQCLHATSNIRKTMANVRKLLKPNGRLVMVETTKDSLDIQLFASCFRGWWLSEEPERKWSPSLSIDFWQQVLTETRFSGIDFSVKDCEDDDLYAMQVILSTAAPGADVASPEDAELLMVVPDHSKDLSVASVLQEQLRNLCKVRTCPTAQIIDAKRGGSSYLVVAGDKWAPHEADMLQAAIQKCTGALKIATENLDPDSRAHKIQSLQSTKPIVTLNLQPGADPLGHNTQLAIANIFKASFYGTDLTLGRNEYFSTSSGHLRVPRVTPFSTLGSKSLRLGGNNNYVIVSRSVGLIAATVVLLASLGARSIYLVLTSPKDRIESDSGRVRTFADDVRAKTGCQVVIVSSPSDLEKSTSVGGIIDFGRMEEDADLAHLAEDSESNANIIRFDKATTENIQFHVRFAPLHEAFSPESQPHAPDKTSMVFTGPIATTDEFADEARDRGSRTVELPSILFLLADVVTREHSTHETLFLGLPGSLGPDGRQKLHSDHRFQTLRPRTADQQRPSETAGSTLEGQGGVPASLQLLATTPIEEKVGIIRAGIRSYIAGMFMLPTSEVDEDGPLMQYIDSLTATQLRSWLSAAAKTSLTNEDVATAESICVLAERAAACLEMVK